MYNSGGLGDRPGDGDANSNGLEIAPTQRMARELRQVSIFLFCLRCYHNLQPQKESEFIGGGIGRMI